MLLDKLDFGGVETHVITLSQKLSQMGVDVFIASSGGAFEKLIRNHNIKHFKIPLQNKNSINIIISFFKLKSIVKKYKIDVIHSHTRISSFLGWAILKFIKKIHFITTTHANFKVGPLTKHLTKWGEKTLAVSIDIKNSLTKNYSVPEDQIYLTVNGIDQEVYRSYEIKECENTFKRFKLAKNATRVIHISRFWGSNVTIKCLIEIAPKLKRKIENLEILIVGDGEEFSLLNKKAQEVNEKTGENFIKMLGSQIEVAKLISISDIFIGVSRAALEAMAIGKPVILSGNQGYLGMLDNKNFDLARKSNFCARGEILPNPEVLLKDITFLARQNSKELEKMANDNKKKVEKLYSVEKMAYDALGLYEFIMR